MIIIEKFRIGWGRNIILPPFAALANWWAESSIRRYERRTLVDVPDRLLRDVGLEHLIDVRADESLRASQLNELTRFQR